MEKNVISIVGVVPALLVVSLAGAGQADAGTLYVGAGETYTTIQSAIDAASDGDTIVVRDGYYTGDGNRDIDFRGKAVHLMSENGPGSCVIDAQGNASARHRGLLFVNGEGEDAILEGFTITGGYMDGLALEDRKGGGIYCRDSSPTITRNVITDNACTVSGAGVYIANGSSPLLTLNTISGNEAFEGGGIFCEISSPSIVTNAISGNAVGAGGGGIKCYYSTAQIMDNVIGENRASTGGGVYCDGSSATLVGNTIQDNTVVSYGAGVLTGGSRSPMIVNNAIISNTSEVYGGGLALESGSDGGDPVVAGNMIYANYAEFYGGGVTWEGTTGLMVNNVVANNTAAECAGIYCTALMDISNSTITGNRATSRAGGVYVYGGGPTISNSILWGNTAQQGLGTQIYVASFSGPTIRHSNVAGGENAAYVASGSSLYWEEGNIDEDPLFADPGNGDYHLKSEDGRWDPTANGGAGGWVFDGVTSPCINTGDPTSDYSDEPGFNGGRINMGAYGNTNEASQGKWILPGDTNHDSEVNILDLTFVRSHLYGYVDTGDNWRGDVNEDGKINVLDLIYVRNHLGTFRK